MTEAALPQTSRAARRKFSFKPNLTAIPIYAWVLVLVVLPAALLLIHSFWTMGDIGLDRTPTLDNYDTVLSSSVNTSLILKTVGIALAVSCFATIIAFPMAYIVSQRVKRNRLTMVILVVIPLWVSLLIRVFAWKIILGDNGVLNTALLTLGLTQSPLAFLLYSRFAVFLTLTYVTVPYVFISCYTSLERVPHSVVEAASDLGASGARRFTTVVWPLARPGVAVGFTLAFVLAVGDYLSPSLVGGLNGTMVGSVIVSQFGVANNWPLGAALATILLIAVIAVTAAVARLGRTRGTIEGDIGAGIPTDSIQPAKVARRVMTIVSYSYLALAYAFLYLPLLMIIVFSFNDSTVQSLPLKGFSLHWYRGLTESPDLVAAFVRSIIVGVAAVAISLVVACLFALILVYRRPRGAALLQGGLTLPFLLPGVILGLALAIVFREVGVPFGLVTVVIGHATFVMPIIMGVLLNRLRQMDPSIVQAAMDLGAKPFQTFTGIIFPQLRTALVGSCLLGFTLSFDEVLVTFFLAGNTPTLPIYVYNQLRFGFTPTINALFSVIAVASVAILLVGMRILTRNRDKSANALPF